MASRLRHRGPDDHDLYVSPDGAVVLGHCRLSIIDLSPAGRQPMWNEAGTTALVFNGEIYNFQALRRDLEARGHRFRSRTDSEVILHGYEDEGERILDRLEGMFAFALWDGAAGRLLLARDRLGKKPLYYWRGPEAFVFASELKTLLCHPRVPRAINPQAVRDYLTLGYVPAPLTMFEGIAKLRPAQLLQVDRWMAFTVKEFWDAPVDAPPFHADLDTHARRVRELVTGAVEKRLVSDVPVGALLSGGIDSAVVVGLMREHLEGLQTFTVGFEAGPSTEKLNADLVLARVTARHFRTTHHEVVVDRRTDLLDLLRRAVWHLDEPNANPTVVSTLVVAALAREHGVKVILSGDGGDELFAGYPRYLYDRYVQLAGRVPPAVRGAVLAILGAVPDVGSLGQLRRLLAKTASLEHLDAAGRYLAWRGQFSLAEQEALLSPELLAALPGYDPRRSVAWYMDRHSPPSFQERLSYTDLKLWIADESSMRLDRATMAVSLEARVPFLDHALVEYAMRIPFRVKMKGTHTKYLLRRAFAHLLPDQITAGRKRGFGSPVRWWTQTYLQDQIDQILAQDAVRRAGLLNWEGVASLRRGEGWVRSPVKLWAALVLQLWSEAFLSSTPDTGWPVPVRQVALRRHGPS
jgi:asparagine synthase (glutamine-hydrolysing)